MSGDFVKSKSSCKIYLDMVALMLELFYDTLSNCSDDKLNYLLNSSAIWLVKRLKVLVQLLFALGWRLAKAWEPNLFLEDWTLDETRLNLVQKSVEQK